MKNKKDWDLVQKIEEKTLNKVTSMSVDKFQTMCEEHNIKCWEIDHMIYDLSYALTKKSHELRR
tara:strand:- start:41 stop:232 length:192 start_codon:yes stop_codon:yes gene_type:complete